MTGKWLGFQQGLQSQQRPMDASRVEESTSKRRQQRYHLKLYFPALLTR